MSRSLSGIDPSSAVGGIVVLALVLEGARPLRSIGGLPLREDYMCAAASLSKA